MVHLWVLFALATLLLTACGVSPTPDLDATIQAPAAATLGAPEAVPSGVLSALRWIACNLRLPSSGK